MKASWERNNKIGIRNFTEGTDFHDHVKLQLVRKLRRLWPDSNKYPIYTETNPLAPLDNFPDIWAFLKPSQGSKKKREDGIYIHVWEIQKDISDNWIKNVQEMHKDVNLIIVPLKWVYVKRKELMAEGYDPECALDKVLDEYVVGMK